MDRLGPDNLSPMEGTGPQCHRTGTPGSAASTVRPNARQLIRFSRCLSPTGPITASRQERQIVQS